MKNCHIFGERIHNFGKNNSKIQFSLSQNEVFHNRDFTVLCFMGHTGYLLTLTIGHFLHCCGFDNKTLNLIIVWNFLTM